MSVGGGSIEGVWWIEAPEEARGLTGTAAWVVRLDDPRVDGWLSRSPPLPDDLGAVAARPDAGERLVRRRLARLLIAAAADEIPGVVTLERTPDGGICVTHPDGWFVSLAGRAPWCAIAVGRSPVGIDIEPVAGEPLPSDLLTAAECGWIAGRPAADRLRASLACWVAKEAHAKRLGRPRTLDPAAVETRVTGAPGLVRSGDDGSCVVVTETDAWMAAVALAPHTRSP